MPLSPSAESAFLNQIAWRLAAVIAAGAALVAVILTNSHQSLMAAQAPPPQLEEEVIAEELPPPPERLEVVSVTLPDIGGDVERCIAYCTNYVSAERSFVVFSQGTCVIIDEPTTTPLSDALRILQDCADPEARFVPQQVENGHRLVYYKKAAFNCMFAEEIAEHQGKLPPIFQDLMTPAERSHLKEGHIPPLDAQLGLAARARLNNDAREPQVIKLIRAAPAASQPKDDGAPQS